MLRRQFIAANVRTLIDKECDGNASEFDRIIGKNTSDRLLNRRVNARHSTLERIAEKFNVTVEWLESDNSKGGDAVVSDAEKLKLLKKMHETLSFLIMRGNPADEKRIAWYQSEIDRLTGVESAPKKGRSLKTGTES